MFHCFLLKREEKHVTRRIWEVVAQKQSVLREREENSRGREGYACVESLDSLPRDHREEWRRWKTVDQDCEDRLKLLENEESRLELELHRLRYAFSLAWIGPLKFWPFAAAIFVVLQLALGIGWVASALVAYAYTSVSFSLDRNAKRLDRVLSLLLNLEATARAKEKNISIEDARVEVEELRWVY